MWFRYLRFHAGIKFEFTEKLVGGAAIDELGEPLPKDTLATCKESDAVLLAAIGGYEVEILNTIVSNLHLPLGILVVQQGLRKWNAMVPN